jgi:hypothetical protein
MPASTNNSSAANAVAAAPIPISAARAERDAIVAASTAGALRRQTGGPDPLSLARRIAAALSVGVVDYGFFWVTGLTTDGMILVANSYGLAYIPDGVNLPEQVRMATADSAIPAVERGTWATYPIIAIQGWARHHGKQLRALIGAPGAFTNSDPGVYAEELRPDDLPASGKMQGRSRFEVIAPQAAAQLRAISGAGLTELLPPAPADINPPADRTSSLWFEVAKPMMSSNPNRGVAHLEAFLAYADHAQELALYRAHTAPDAAAQRAAITDWLYWQHLGGLITEAVTSGASV